MRGAQDKPKTLPWSRVLLLLEVVSSEEMQEASVPLRMVGTDRENVSTPQPEVHFSNTVVLKGLF